jgi:hypothetical protein
MWGNIAHELGLCDIERARAVYDGSLRSERSSLPHGRASDPPGWVSAGSGTNGPDRLAAVHRRGKLLG